MARGAGLDETEHARQSMGAASPVGGGRQPEDVGHLLRLKQRYPDLAPDIQRLITLAGQEQRLRKDAPVIGPDASRQRTTWKANMGITIVQKSDLTVRKRNPRIALVLAGGAITGGGFKLGGLKALDDFLVNRKTTDFDIYVGLSAGAFLAAPLASGVTPPEMMRSLEGSSEEFTQFGPLDFYQLELSRVPREARSVPARSRRLPPGVVPRSGREEPRDRRAHRGADASVPYATAASRTCARCWPPIGEALLATRPFPFPLDYLPSGLFDNASIERYLRHNLERRHMPNNFKALFQARKRELYIVAMNLDTAERVVFGHDEDSSLTISEAVQASTALPGFYKPARIRGIDYVDGGVRRTANIDVAIEHGADLIICYNPFRPFSNRVVRKYDPEKDDYVAEGMQLADRGMLTILNQVLRTLLHSRLQLGLRQYQDDPQLQGRHHPASSPTENDIDFFQMTPLAFWERRRAGAARLRVGDAVDRDALRA